MGFPHDTSHSMAPRDAAGGTGQSIAVALASALVFFTVVGLIASRASVSNLGAQAPTQTGVFALTVPAAERAALGPATVEMTAPSPDPGALGGSYAVTVPARQAVLLDVGFVQACPGGGDSSAVWIPPLEPGHHVLTVGLHEILVTAVEH